MSLKVCEIIIQAPKHLDPGEALIYSAYKYDTFLKGIELLST